MISPGLGVFVCFAVYISWCSAVIILETYLLVISWTWYAFRFFLWRIRISFFLEGAIYEKTKRQLYLKSSEARERSKDPMVVYKARFEEHFGGVDELKRGRPALPAWMEMDQLCLWEFVKLGVGGWWGEVWLGYELKRYLQGLC